MSEANQNHLALLEAGHDEAEAAKEVLLAAWAREDEATTARRALEMERIEQGARDRDAVRVKLGGVSKLVKPEPSMEPPAREQEPPPAAPRAPVEGHPET